MTQEFIQIYAQCQSFAMGCRNKFGMTLRVAVSQDQSVIPNLFRDLSANLSILKKT